MLKMVKKFFDFCSQKNRRKFYIAAALGVLEAIFTAMKIPAAFVAISAVLESKIDTQAILTVIGLMLVSTVGKMIVSRFSTMLQTEGGYDTCALKRIEIGEHLRYLPMGYFNDTSLGHITSVTTNTMEQTGAIARAIMKDAPIIILDEATANVDPENEKELTEAIENLTRQKTIIMIAHRLKTVRGADQIVVVDKGKIVQKGKHDELMAQDGIYRNFITGRKQAVSWKIA